LLYSSGFPAKAARTIRPLSQGNGETTRFDWFLANESDLWAQVERSGDAGPRLEFFADAGAAGEVASQLIRLAPGTYALSFKAGALEGGTTANPYLTASCATGKTLGQIDATNSGELRFEVPARGCGVVKLAVSVRGEFGSSDAKGWVKDFHIRRLR
jgi:hypothetical protein